VFCNF